MSTLRIKIPFSRRKSTGTSNGFITFSLPSIPKTIPFLYQRVLITHTNVPSNSGLKTKLDSISTNTVTGLFQNYIQNTTQDSILQADGFSNFFVIKYDDTTFSQNQFGGDCSGFIEFDYNPTDLDVLKPVENSVIVSENVPYDGNDGRNTLVSNIASGSTIAPMFFVKRNTVNSIFANTLKSLNLPVSTAEMSRYTRTQLGYYTTASGATYDTLLDGVKYNWNPVTTTGYTGPTVVHPTTGNTGQFYDTVLQTIGSYNFLNDNLYTPVENSMYLMFEIPQNQYGEIIDGKTFRLTMPYWNPSGSTTGYTENNRFGNYNYNTGVTSLSMYGTYNLSNLGKYDLDKVTSEKDLSLQVLGNRPDLGNLTSAYESNIVLLFSDTIKRPQFDGYDSWVDGNEDALDGIKVFQNNATRNKALYDNRRDECVGFVALDKGFVVITHPLIVDSFFVNAFNGQIDIQGPTGGTREKVYIVSGTTQTRGNVTALTGRTDIITTIDGTNYDWDSTQFVYNSTGNTPTIDYLSYNSEKSLVVTCLASTNEFFKSTNDTAKELLNVDNEEYYATFKSDTSELHPVLITRLGIHDANGNLLAVCVPAQPIKKYWYDLTAFSIKIKV
jgi:hypothetical protein